MSINQQAMKMLFIISAILLYTCNSFGQEQSVYPIKLVEDTLFKPKGKQLEGLGDKRLDSIVHYYSSNETDLNRMSKEEFIYIDHKRKILHKEYSWANTNAYWWNGEEIWIGEERKEYIFDNLGNKISFETSLAEVEDSTWKWADYYFRHEYGWTLNGNLGHFYMYGKDWKGTYYCLWKKEWKYNSFGSADSFETLRWDSNTNTWTGHNTTTLGTQDVPLESMQNFYGSVPGGKEEFMYDNYGQRILRLRYKWNTQTNEWGTYQKQEFKYYESGNLQTDILYSWFSEWVAGEKNEYSYDHGGNLIQQVGYRWNRDSLGWVERWKSEKTFDELGNLISNASFQWNPELNRWIGNRQDLYSFDEQGNRLLWINFNWNSNINEWNPSNKYENFYDGNNQVLSIWYQWSTESNNWNNFRKYEYSYDEVGNQTLETYYKWDNDLINWKLSSKSYYYYSPTITAIDYSVVDDVNLFPNPTSGIIIITGQSHPSEVKIFTIQGQLIKSTKNVQNQIDISDLDPGIYIVNLMVGEKVVVKKVVKN